MHVVVTGFDARAARPTPGHARHSLGYLITAILEHWGHKVTQTTSWLGDWQTAADVDSADRILVGLGSPLALTSTYTYPAMYIMNEYWEDSRLRLFLDDPDTNKIVHGASSAIKRARETDPLFTNKAFRSRAWFDEASEDRHDEMYTACEKLLWPGDWPKTYAPVQSRWSSMRTTQIAGTPYYAHGLDPTNVLWEMLPPARRSPQAHRSSTWLVEPLRAPKWASKTATHGAKMAVNVKPSLQRLYTYPNAVGVLESPALISGVPGWWTPAATIAAATGTFFHTPIDPETDPSLTRSPYYTLPTKFETFPLADREEVVQRQIAELFRAPTIDEFVKEILL